MSEFDFDELDKAVAGVLSTEADSTTETVENLDDTNMEKDVPQAEPSRETQASTRESVNTAPATRRTSGRFMDVVHPSSDMRTRTTPAFIGTSSSRGETAAFTPPVSKPELEDDTEASTKNDTHTDNENDTTEAAVGEWSKQLESPFLTDAKVEKRPLGGFGLDPNQVRLKQDLLEAPEDELKLEASDEPLLEASYPDPIDFAAQSTALPIEKEDTGAVQPEDEPFVEAPVKQETATLQEQPVGPTSITQQYTEQAVSTQQHSGAIFDTENYHKPLTVPAKKHSGVFTIVWILLLVILGAGAGVAFYLFVLPML